MCLINLSNCPGNLVLTGHHDRTIENPNHKYRTTNVSSQAAKNNQTMKTNINLAGKLEN